MNARDALIQEILELPEPLLRELQQYMVLLVNHQNKPSKASQSWPPGYFQRTAGAFSEEPLERSPQFPPEKRGEW
jgi:hypothetical protein